jgi:hypothetical protein
VRLGRHGYFLFSEQKVLSGRQGLSRLNTGKQQASLAEQLQTAGLADTNALATLGAQQQEELRRLKRELVEVQKRVFGGLDPWQTVEVARHPNRPKTSDYLGLVFDEFVELHGDKSFGDDRAMLTGFAKLEQRKVMVIGHQKGTTLAERQACHFGCAHPEGYRKAMGKMRLAAKYGLPVICLIDTPGAYPGVGAEERGQAQVIAESMFLLATRPVPVVCVVIGAGGSGGAAAHPSIGNPHLGSLNPPRARDLPWQGLCRNPTQTLSKEASKKRGLITGGPRDRSRGPPSSSPFLPRNRNISLAPKVAFE